MACRRRSPGRTGYRRYPLAATFASGSDAAQAALPACLEADEHSLVARPAHTAEAVDVLAPERAAAEAARR
eukprot:2709773-Prymnesium_polylepis.5